jgi:protein translocase SecG subunit
MRHRATMPRPVEVYDAVGSQLHPEKSVYFAALSKALGGPNEQVATPAPGTGGRTHGRHLRHHHHPGRPAGLVVLAQNPKGGGLAAGFTGAQQIGGVQRTADFMEKATWTLAGLALMVLCLVIRFHAKAAVRAEPMSWTPPSYPG